MVAAMTVEWMKTDRVAQLTGLEEERVRQLAREGKFTAKKTGTQKQNRLLINWESVVKWLDSLPSAAKG